MISVVYNQVENKLINLIQTHVTGAQDQCLQQMVPKSKQDIFIPSLSAWKRINQKIRLKDIRLSLGEFKKIKDYFNCCFPLIQILCLAPSSCQYYAGWIQKARVSQVKQIPDQHKLNLYLIAFIQHQFYLRQDALIDVLLKSVQACKNKAKIKRDQLAPEQQKEQVTLLELISKNQMQLQDIIEEIYVIIKKSNKSEHEKLREIEILVSQHMENNTNNAAISSPCQKLNNLFTDDKYYDFLEEHSSLLQNRVSEIIKHLEFDEETSNKNIVAALNYYKENEGHIKDDAPISFLDKKETKVIFDNQNNLRQKLYKSLFYIHIANAIKSGHLNLKYSYRYKSIQGYLIDKETWEQKKESLLAASGLSNFVNIDHVLSELKSALDKAYADVNNRIEKDDNEHIRFTSTGKYILTTPKLEKKNTEAISDILFEGGFVPIIQVLRDVDRSTHFTESFKHYSIKHHKLKPDVETIIAGIMAQGHNLGINKISNISIGINNNTLRQVVTWFFTQQNLQAANNKIIALINKLSLSKIYKYSPHLTTTSSDGQKYQVAVDSLLANYSYKYFGKDKGITVYTFVDDSESLFYSTVMSASEREAPYVIDGLLHNEVVKSSIHSTDMHGFTESIFATTHFMGASFAPRFKNLNRQYIYAFSAKSTYAKKCYKILPSRTINTKLITEHWDDILRFMATIKLKETTASQLFKRLSSYAKDHALYQAIKEFGRIIKTQFILTYMDDVELRQRIEKQLSRIELSNKFGKAVFFDKSHEFKVSSPEEQQDIVACRTLIQNSIVLWNYLYLSQRIMNAKKQEQILLLSTIKEGSLLSWAHVNMQGEYDFTKAMNMNRFDMEEILSFRLDVNVA